MKTKASLLIICAFGFFTTCHGQSKTKQDSSTQINLLDEQTKMFSGIFDLAGAGAENPMAGAENYTELIEKMDAPEELKQQLREMYNVYDKSLDPKKKDSLKLAVGKMLNNAMEKTKNDPEH
ncbi:hypothetical protein HPE56_06100 [Maribacter sp. ANRC-HE7]|uniref:Uncharacterized protein n=1 Tax=Maribacter aquimaris TaxID=2737171 RepID=A0ABR7UXP3_9FLAO|nr:hypothetical protein [Maribacter aquimaris]MBD0777357.1 hypothetical protein [Maribacter aquimaris]